uniref:Uncharacterized protein n=1 Tax=viral metagenome TaxID=1070528 RepID=A0A6M3JK88_9ZZZZ
MINNGLAIGDFIGRIVYDNNDPDIPADNDRLRADLTEATTEYNQAVAERAMLSEYIEILRVRMIEAERRLERA